MPEQKHTAEPLKIEAMVKMNGQEAYVFNRSPIFKYEREGDLLWAQDGCFFSTYYHELPTGRFKAFAGRKFDLQMKDGSVTKCDGQWWDGGIGALANKLGLNLIDSSIQTIKGLQSCYVFYAGHVEFAELNKMIAQYEGCVYPYDEYEKIITFDDRLKKCWGRERKLERAKKSLIKEAKRNLTLAPFPKEKQNA